MKGMLKSFFLFQPIVRVLLIGTVFMFIGISMSSPFLAIYLAKNMGLSATVIGTIIGSGAIAGMIGGFLGGVVSDKVGKNKLLVLSLFTSAFVFIGYATVNEVIFLYLLSSLSGLSNTIFHTVSRAMISELTEKQERTQAFAFLNLALNIGWGVGPLLGVAFGVSGTATPFLITALIFVLYGFILVYQVKSMQESAGDLEKKDVAPEFSVKNVFHTLRKDTALMMFVIGSILLTTAWGQFTVLLSQHLLIEFPNGGEIFGIMLVINAIVIVMIQLPIAKWAEKKSLKLMINLGVSMVAIGLIGFGYSSTALFLFASMIIFSLAEALLNPLFSTYIDKLSPAHLKGSYFGATNLTMLGLLLSPVLGGFILDTYGGSVLYSVFGTLAVVSLIFYGISLKCYEGNQQVVLIEQEVV
ncbi:MFS family permease [Bacillus mesophilus]|uniref:MFS transporter n=1 Tax=Bacillus mesophilus TaxID=1808955 RepID=A0A6M0Q409_9BACI|nr:MFS transporter [Bacillus mesophilus]MBM7660226.1 MFS family permease [Bacillus mesophilus]NEY70944.1 MFS transporter [Bacillus mesophilus]